MHGDVILSFSILETLSVVERLSVFEYSVKHALDLMPSDLEDLLVTNAQQRTTNIDIINILDACKFLTCLSSSSIAQDMLLFNA